MPNGKRLQAATHELEADELTYAVKLLMDAAGIDRLRITGGEPMLTPKFDSFLPAVMDLGLKDVSVTTNGQFDSQVLANAMVEQAFLFLNRGVGAALAVLIFVGIFPIMVYNINRLTKEA
mgnify:CR=1 FL=1